MSEKFHMQEITIDGNDGTGKSTVIAKLRELGYVIKDRGIPTKLTDDPNFPVPPNGIYVILDTSVETREQQVAISLKNFILSLISHFIDNASKRSPKHCQVPRSSMRISQLMVLWKIVYYFFKRKE